MFQLKLLFFSWTINVTKFIWSRDYGYPMKFSSDCIQTNLQNQQLATAKNRGIFKSTLTFLLKLRFILKIQTLNWKPMDIELVHCLNISTTPLRQCGFRQFLAFSWTTLRGKHCWHPIATMGFVDHLGPFYTL